MTADQLLRFAGVGVVSTLGYLFLFVAWRPLLGAFGANAVAMAIATLFNTAVHRELSRGTDGQARRGRLFAVAGGLYLVSLGLTTLGSGRRRSGSPPVPCCPSCVALTVANVVAAVFRFAVLRAWIFRPTRPRRCRPHGGVPMTDLTPAPDASVGGARPAGAARRRAREPATGAARVAGTDLAARAAAAAAWPASSGARRATRPGSAPPCSPSSSAPPSSTCGTSAPAAGPTPSTRRPCRPGTKSWKAFFFGSSDSSNFITVDKPPAFLWPMEISARIFGLNSWSMLAPQALEGVATVGLVYLSVRRWFSAQAALLGGAVVALTPVAAMMFRYNNPDAMLALLLTGATYATIRGLERAQTKWLVLAGALVGFGFITKMMQAFLILPVMAVVYLLAAPTGWWRRVWQVVLMGVSVLVAGGLVGGRRRAHAGRGPALRRRVAEQQHPQPDLRLQRLRPARPATRRAASAAAGVAGAEHVGPDRVTRLFNAEFGNMMSWLLPGALVMGAVLLAVTFRARRTDRERAALLLWGGSLVSIGLTISLAQGIIHPYYTVALAPPLGASSASRTMGLWERRDTWAGRVGLAAGLAATVVLELRPPRPHLELVPRAAALRARGGRARRRGHPGPPAACASVPKLAVGLVAALGLGAALAAPLFSTVATAATPHDGAIPSVTPTPAGGFGGPGGGFPGGSPVGSLAGPSAVAASPAAPSGGGFPGGGFPGGGGPRRGHRHGSPAGPGPVPGGGFPGGAAPRSAARRRRRWLRGRAAAAAAAGS